MTENSRTLTTVVASCKVIETIKELDGATLSELASHLEMTKGGVHHHVASLQSCGFLLKDGNEYKLSHRFYNIGQYVRLNNILYQVGREEVSALAKRTDENCHLMIEEFGKGIYLHKAISDRGISDRYHNRLLYETDYLHWSSTGKAVLAHLPHERIEEIIDEHGLPANTANTITDRDELFSELKEIREQGYALNDEEQIRGTRAVGAAIVGGDEDVIGAISLSGPLRRINDKRFYDEYPELIVDTANIIEVEIETSEE